MTQHTYMYPGTNVLKNKLNIRNKEELEQAEKYFTLKRMVELYNNRRVTGSFNRKHIQAIHYHIFQDLYEWAGEWRTVQIQKGSTNFLATSFLHIGLGDLEKRLVKMNAGGFKTKEAFSDAAAVIYTDLNYIHPFREGNGRTQREFIRQLALYHGFEMDYIDERRERLFEASVVDDYTMAKDALLAIIKNNTVDTALKERTRYDEEENS